MTELSTASGALADSKPVKPVFQVDLSGVGHLLLVSSLLEVFALLSLDTRLLDLLLEGLGEVLDAHAAAGQGSIPLRTLLGRKWKDFIVAFVFFFFYVGIGFVVRCLD